MRRAVPHLLIAVYATYAVFSITRISAQDSAADAHPESSTNAASVPLVGHPFSATKYAWQVKLLPSGKTQFIRNERYPTNIARDADGRIMMQRIPTKDLLPECDHLDRLVPPVCPVWGVFVIDPVAHTLTHWLEGERGMHSAVEFPLTQAHLEETARETGELPSVPPEFTEADGKVTTTDLGDKMIEGIQAHGVRSTLQFAKEDSGQNINLTRIHEVWTAPEMKLVVRVIDGDPNGLETFWGLEKVLLAPNPSLFQPPADYKKGHEHSDEGTMIDFEYLHTWFSK